MRSRNTAMPGAVILVRKVNSAAPLQGQSLKRNMLPPRCVPANTHSACADRDSVAGLHSTVGLTASAGVAVTYGAVRILGLASSVLVLIGVALFFALGAEPAVSWLVRRKLPRWAAVTIVAVVVFAVLAASLAAAVPLLWRKHTNSSRTRRTTCSTHRITPR